MLHKMNIFKCLVCVYVNYNAVTANYGKPRISIKLIIRLNPDNQFDS
jgi:hypothetical protein